VQGVANHRLAGARCGRDARDVNNKSRHHTPAYHHTHGLRRDGSAESRLAPATPFFCRLLHALACSAPPLPPHPRIVQQAQTWATCECASGRHALSSGQGTVATGTVSPPPPRRRPPSAQQHTCLAPIAARLRGAIHFRSDARSRRRPPPSAAPLASSLAWITRSQLPLLPLLLQPALACPCLPASHLFVAKSNRYAHCPHVVSRSSDATLPCLVACSPSCCMRRCHHPLSARFQSSLPRPQLGSRVSNLGVANSLRKPMQCGGSCEHTLQHEQPLVCQGAGGTGECKPAMMQSPVFVGALHVTKRRARSGSAVQTAGRCRSKT